MNLIAEYPATVFHSLTDQREMALNKKQKKQLDVIRKKLNALRQQLAGEKKQMDDPAAVQRLEEEIAKLDDQRRAIEAEK